MSLLTPFFITYPHLAVCHGWQSLPQGGCHGYGGGDFGCGAVACPLLLRVGERGRRAEKSMKCQGTNLYSVFSVESFLRIPIKQVSFYNRVVILKWTIISGDALSSIHIFIFQKLFHVSL